MKLKAKLFSTIAAVCMVICLLSVGIWAASKATVNVKGTVSFAATDVEATVTATFADCVETTGLSKTVTFTTTGASVDEGEEDQTFTQVWDNMDYTFVKNADGTIKNITLTINVKNNSTERKLLVDVTDNSVDGDVVFTFENVTSDELAPGADKDYTITMSVKEGVNASKTFSGDFDVLVTLNNGDVA